VSPKRSKYAKGHDVSSGMEVSHPCMIPLTISSMTHAPRKISDNLLL
jgi:hypothetical protein